MKNTNDTAASSVAWRETLLANLAQGGKVCQNAAEYIADHNVAIGFSQQSTGARWTLDGCIDLNEQYYSLKTDPADPRMLAIVVHEARHLEQGFGRALSVEGELEAWQTQYRALEELGRPIRGAHWDALMRLSPPLNRKDLRAAASTMRKAAGGWRYLIWLLPLRPKKVLATIVGGVSKLKRKR